MRKSPSASRSAQVLQGVAKAVSKLTKKVAKK